MRVHSKDLCECMILYVCKYACLINTASHRRLVNSHVA